MSVIQEPQTTTTRGIGKMFRSNALFGGVPSESLDSLEILVEERHYEAGELVFDEGAEGRHLYLVGKGSILISKKGRGGQQETLAMKREGDFFGEMSLLDQEPRSARATAAEATVLGKLDRAGLERLLASSPEAAMHFTRTLMKGLRSTNSLFIEELLNAERLSLLGSTMSGIVHDFRNPIASIMMVSEWLSARNDPKLESKGAALQRATDRMQTMIQELLDFSRGHSQVHLEPTTVASLVHDLEEEILTVLPGELLEVRRDVLYDGPIVADRNRIIRLLCNVIKNAVEAMPDGGQLTVRVFRENDLVKFEVEDTGCGIPPEVVARIFEPFVTHGKANGTGLGMAIAKSVVEAHRGMIWIESEEGQGTICHIALPVE